MYIVILGMCLTSIHWLLAVDNKRKLWKNNLPLFYGNMHSHFATQSIWSAISTSSSHHTSSICQKVFLKIDDLWSNCTGLYIYIYVCTGYCIKTHPLFHWMVYTFFNTLRFLCSNTHLQCDCFTKILWIEHKVK